MNQNLAAIGRVGLALHEARGFEPVYQLDGGVMAQREPVGQLGDGRVRAGREPFERQQRLMLLRLDSMSPCLHFAEVEKLAKLAPEIGELLIFA